MNLNGNSGYGASVGNSVTGSDRFGWPPVAITVCKPVIVWHAKAGQ